MTAYRSKNATEGKFSGFILAIQTGHVPAGAIRQLIEDSATLCPRRVPASL